MTSSQPTSVLTFKNQQHSALIPKPPFIAVFPPLRGYRVNPPPKVIPPNSMVLRDGFLDTFSQ